MHNVSRPPYPQPPKAHKFNTHTACTITIQVVGTSMETCIQPPGLSRHHAGFGLVPPVCKTMDTLHSGDN